ncbi:MAG: NAD(P)-dependent oxidoreductase [Bacteroidota bacterium]|nr:NAD(P)-dependent oxidoreductase [Bacteroidota bacterium]
MKLLITGVNGFVAGSVLAHAKGKWEIHGIGRSESLANEPELIYHTLDLLDDEKFADIFNKIRPDSVIHTAAMANIDTCQKNKEMAERVNVGITKTLVRLCQESGSKMVFCSTDAVFDGTKGDYTESDAPRAVNFYAETKIKAEQSVLSASDKNVVARLALVMGLPVIGKGNSFLADTIGKLEKGIQVPFPVNEIRTPIDVITLGSALVELAGNQFGGIIHLSGCTKINRYQMALEIAKTLGYSSELILSVDSNAMEGRAPRSNDVSMYNSLARQILKTPMRTLSEGLELTLNFKPAK